MTSGKMNFKNDCLMKNLFKVLFVAAATTVFFSCNKEIEDPNYEVPVVVRTVQFSASPITKTVFGTPDGTSLPTLWTANKTVGISLNFATAKQSTAPEVAGGGTTATFNADIEDGGSSPYTFYAVSPYSSIISISSDHKSANINIPSSQTPLSTSVDESAQILVAKNNVGASFPTSSVSMDFDHLTAYGKISFKNLSLADGEAIASIALTAPKYWAGRYYYYFEDDGDNDAGDLVANSATETITIATSSSTNIWFACAPVDLRGDDVDVVITTNQGTTYSKTITIPTDATGDKHLFKSGKVNAFTINMEGITADGSVDYVLVTDASDLAVGSQVIIAGLGDVDYALSTTQNTNNRVAASQAKSADDQLISSPGAAVQILTITEGNKANTLGLSTGSGYLCAASSGSNYLRTQETLDNEGSWTVEINSTTGEATIIAQGDNTRNYIRFNPNSGNPIFACYSSSPSLSTTGSPVAIYMYDPTTWNLSSIEVTNEPDKTTYEAGEDFDATGMEVTAHYVDAADNTHTKNVVLNNGSLTISPSTNLTAGTTSVSISFAGKSTTQAITVSAPITWDLKSIAVTTAPTKTTYTVGETFDPTGMVVTATYENHDNTEQTKQEVVDNGDLTFSPTTSTALTTSDISISISYGGKSTTQAITVTEPGLVDVLNNSWTGITGTSYTAKTGLAGSDSDAVYSVQAAGGNSSIQLRNQTPSGIVSTVSGGTLKSISVTWNSNTNNARTLAVYAKNTAYSGPADLYDNNTKGTLVHTFAKSDGDASWTFDSDYEYIGLLASGALYLDEIDIEWKSVTWNLSSIEVTNEPDKTAYEAGEDFDATGMEVTAHYVDAADNTHTKDVVLDNGDLTISPSTSLTAGTTSVTITYGGQSTTQAITVSAAKVWDLKSIAVKTAPTKTTYTEGEYFDPTGLVITPTYENHANTEETKTGDDVAYSNATAASFTFAPTTTTTLQTSNTSVSISYTEGGITKSTTQTITVNEDQGTSWHAETWSELGTTGTTYTSGSVDGDLGTWSYVGACLGQTERTSFTNERAIIMGSTGDNAKLTSPTFDNGINGIKFNYWVNNTARKFKITVYEDGDVVKTETVTPTSASTIIPYEVTVSTTGSTHFTVEPTTTSRRVSVGDFQVNY